MKSVLRNRLMKVHDPSSSWAGLLSCLSLAESGGLKSDHFTEKGLEQDSFPCKSEAWLIKGHGTAHITVSEVCLQTR